MIDYDVLKKYGTTKERLSEVCRAEHGTRDYETRKKLESEIEDAITEGVYYNLRSYHPFAAADLAWDGQVYNESTIPLQLYAQGKVAMKEAVNWCKDAGMSDTQMEKFCTKDEKTGEFLDADISKFIDVNMNMVRSFVQRRHAAQDARYTRQYPYLKYDTYDRSYEAQLRADVISQRMEVMANSYGYRHQDSQTIRDMLLYPWVVQFPAESWHVERQYRGIRSEEGVLIGDESYISREGVPYVVPHPSRVFYDTSSPLSSINSDTGCDYFGYWEVVKYGDIKRNPNYFNRDSISSDLRLSSALKKANPYLQVYYPCQMNWPGFNLDNDPAGRNDRENNIGIYSPDHQDNAVVLTEFRKKLVPKDYGIGEYPYPVWVRFVVASEKTVIFAEIMPSCPGHYFAYNVKDNRLYNNSFAHEIMPYQDQMSNLLSQLLLSQKQSLLKILLLNLDMLEPEHVKQVEKIINGGVYLNKPIRVGYKDDKYRQLGKSSEPMKVVGTDQQSEVQNIVRSMIELMSFAERMLNFSPQELGQPAPRVASATEIVEMASSVATLYNFVSKGIDEGLSSKKRYLYEALVSLSKGKLQIPVAGMYPSRVVELAGFKSEEMDTAPIKDGTPKKTLPKSQTIMGEYRNLVFNYNFNAREGGDRSQNHRTAELLIQVLPMLMQIPQVIEMMGSEKMYELLNAIMRNLGTGIEFKLSALEDEVAREGTEQEQVDNDTIINALDQITQVLAEVEAQGGENARQIQEVTQIIEGVMGGGGRRERGQRFEGAPVEDPGQQPGSRMAPRQTAAPMTPEAPMGGSDPFAAPEGTAQQRPNPINPIRQL